MNAALRFLEWATRPRVVLGLRVLWDFAFGAFLVLAWAFVSLQAFHNDTITAGLLTLVAGGWGLISLLRPKV